MPKEGCGISVIHRRRRRGLGLEGKSRDRQRMGNIVGPKLANMKRPHGRSGNCVLFKEITMLPSQTSATYHFTKRYFLSLSSSL